MQETASPIVDDPNRYPVRLKIDGVVVSRHTMYDHADRARVAWCRSEADRLYAAYAAGDRSMALPMYHEDRDAEGLMADFFCRAEERTRVETWTSCRDPLTRKVYGYKWA